MCSEKMSGVQTPTIMSGVQTPTMNAYLRRFSQHFFAAAFLPPHVGSIS
jgi:hypothetical protein